MKPEAIVVAAVRYYFSQSKFRTFRVQTEYPIQFGSKKGFADVVLVDNSDGSLTAITECKKEGIVRDGVEQLKSYLNATATRFGIFANSTEPNSWTFYENLGPNHFRDMTISEFEKRVSTTENSFIQSDERLTHSRLTTGTINSGGSMKIKPTLYVGLGTTGTQIINHLRKRKHDEYGKTEYPIFRYVSIETDAGTDGIVPEIDNNIDYLSYSENGTPEVHSKGPRPEAAANKVIHTTIPDTYPIKESLNKGLPHTYNKDLDTWLDPRILDIDAAVGLGGAGNLRMIGRLSLWENWDKQSRVQQNLRESFDAIWEMSNREKASNNLKRHFGAEFSVDDKNRNVFIVGTLCGGTCSGMLLDIAYYFRHIGNENTKVYGIFTLYDEALALEAPGIQLANCYASLVELDYYKRPETEYYAKFPNKLTIQTNKAPFDIATFLSATNMAGERFVNTNGQFVKENLDQMVASDLFLRSLGVDSIIDADLVNAPAFDNRFGEKREGGQFVQYMFGSGVEMVWLPKNRTVKTAATKLIEELRSKWVNGNNSHLETPDTLFDNMLGDIRADVYASTGSFEKHLNEESSLINDPTDVYSKLADLVEGGTYYKRFDEGRKNCTNKAVTKLRDISKPTLIAVSESIQSELEKSTYPNQLESLDDIASQAQQVEQGSLVSAGGFLGLGSTKELSIEKLRAETLQRLQALGRKLKGFFTKRVLSDVLGEIKKLSDSDNMTRSTIETKFKEAINYFPIKDETPTEIVKAAERLAEEYPGLSTQESINGLVNLLSSSSPHAFHWHISNELRQRFDNISENAISEFSKDAARRSSPYQKLTQSYMRNHRLRLEQPGGETQLFRYLLASQPPQGTSTLQLESQYRYENFPIRHLNAIYQMEAGFTPDDLLAIARLKEEYDSYQETSGYPIHIEKDANKFNPDAILAEVETNKRSEEIQKDCKVLRQLLPFIRRDNPNGFQNVSFNGINGSNGSGNTNGIDPIPTGVLEIKVVGEGRFHKTFPDNEEGWDKLAKDTVACENFIFQTRSEFRNLYEADNQLALYIEAFLDTVNDQNSEEFYEDYIRLLQKHIQPPQN